MPPQGREPPPPPLVVRLLRGPVPVECQPREQLRTTEPWATRSGSIQSNGELVGLGDHVTRSGGGHPGSVTPLPDGDAPPLQPGSTVVHDTDGLVERRGSSIDDGTELLRTAATTLARAGLTLDQLCDALLAELGAAFDDDVALLAARAHPGNRPRPPEAGPSVEPADLRGRRLIRAPAERSVSTSGADAQLFPLIGLGDGRAEHLPVAGQGIATASPAAWAPVAGLGEDGRAMVTAPQSARPGPHPGPTRTPTVPPLEERS
ncbi:SpoIIE family protein phosphatase [Blastococcus capsensis]|uniref:SpoIIE family protein phosphatase n=1 Tax=Blastococcus capsensis TaxID=1564163 RepID=UPI003D6B4CFC